MENGEKKILAIMWKAILCFPVESKHGVNWMFCYLRPNVGLIGTSFVISSWFSELRNISRWRKFSDINTMSDSDATYIHHLPLKLFIELLSLMLSFTSASIRACNVRHEWHLSRDYERMKCKHLNQSTQKTSQQSKEISPIRNACYT